jgi:hypothetical protein
VYSTVLTVDYPSSGSTGHVVDYGKSDGANRRFLRAQEYSTYWLKVNTNWYSTGTVQCTAEQYRYNTGEIDTGTVSVYSV